MIGLTDDEITKAIDEVYYKGTGIYQVNVADKAIAKAQLKKVVEWGNERCPHTKDFDGIENIPALLYKRFCGVCWQALLEEVKE